MKDLFYYCHIICDKLALESYINCKKPMFFISGRVIDGV